MLKDEKEMKKNILVFPCGSEVGLEIYHALRYVSHIDLIGASSVSDNGLFFYDRYVEGLPFINEPDFIAALKNVIANYTIDAIIPAMDKVACCLKAHEKELGCTVISSPFETTRICLSKEKTYHFLKGAVRTPLMYRAISEVSAYPVFLKPDTGYGSRNTRRADNAQQAQNYLETCEEKMLILEYIEGKEYTVDCFTDRNGKLLFVGPRERSRIINGISVCTRTLSVGTKPFLEIAEKINTVITLRGAWFFQLKENKHQELVLMEVAPRLAGSSALYRNAGVNFALLSVYDAFDIPIKITCNHTDIEFVRPLSRKFRINILFDKIYVDFDDCLIIRGKVNELLVAFLYQEINKKVRIILITKCNTDIAEELKRFRLYGLFDEIICIDREDQKFRHMDAKNAIFIDDSYSERREVAENLHIPVFSPDMVGGLSNF